MARVVIELEDQADELHIHVEASPPFPLTEDGLPDVDHDDFTDAHAAALSAVSHLTETAGDAAQANVNVGEGEITFTMPRELVEALADATLRPDDKVQRGVRILRAALDG